MQTNIYNPLSGLYLNKNNFKKATDLIEKSIVQKQQSGDLRGLAFSYYGKAKIHAKLKEYLVAEEYYHKSIAIHLEMGEKLGLGYAYNKLGILYLEQNRFDEAILIANRSLDIFEIFRSSMIKMAAVLLLHKIYEKQNNPVLALQYLKMYLAEQDNNVHLQTHQIINNFKIITTNEAKALEDKLQIEKMEQIAQAKQDFLSTMSHEIRTPLNAVISITNLLSDKTKTSKKEAEELLGILKYSSNNLLNIVNNVLDFTKLEEGKVELEKSVVHFRNLMNNIKNSYTSLAYDKGLQLELFIDDSIEIAYELDATKLAQIVGNLVGNAIKFTKQGKIIVSIEKTITQQNEKRILFKVTDTGIGISNDFIDKLFDKFSQPKKDQLNNVGGSGLGLAIVKELLLLHGSQIFVETTLGVGTTFSFALKLEAKKLNLDMPPIANENFNNLSVLIAEDNKINMMVALKILGKWGIKPDTAVDGQAALEKIFQRKYDLILLDLHMPIIGGHDVATRIRSAQNINQDTKTYAFTADVTAENTAKYKQYFDGFLHKPIQLDLLHNVLKLASANSISSNLSLNYFEKSLTA